ncbi:SMI1/KNR4 family protein [Fusobacterium vincentii]|nr:SMI1/KNR4 family protein [Fusobacterium vincentii]
MSQLFLLKNSDDRIFLSHQHHLLYNLFMEIFIISPSEKGKKGQIVRYLHDSNEIEVIADSFDEYLEKFMEYGLDFISEDTIY